MREGGREEDWVHKSGRGGCLWALVVIVIVQDGRGQLFLESESEGDSDWDAGNGTKAYCLKGLGAQVKWQGCRYILQLQYCSSREVR